MTESSLFTMALGLQDPWFVKNIEFKEGLKNEKELHLIIDHKPRVKFDVEGESCSVYDHVQRSWRHLNFFQHVCYLHARVPRVKTSNGNVLNVDLPWSQPGSSFTLLFEALVVALAKSGMSMLAIGNYLNISDKSAFNIVSNLVVECLANQSLDDCERLCIDETSCKKGHEYLTILSDIDDQKVVGIGFGKDVNAAKMALSEMTFRSANPSATKAICMDMSPSYISFAKTSLPQADIVFDKFHISALLNKAVDDVRKKEHKEKDGLKKTKFLWLKNFDNLNVNNQEKVNYLKLCFPKLGEAHRLKELFREVWNQTDPIQIAKQMAIWIEMALESKIKPIIEFVQTLERHMEGIEAYFKHIVTNALAESLNARIQVIKRIAKGYKNKYNFKLMIYFHLGGLDLNIPTK